MACGSEGGENVRFKHKKTKIGLKEGVIMFLGCT
jgi:hypothetical protein